MSGIKQCQFPPVEAHPKPTISCCVHHLREENSLISLFHDLKKKKEVIFQMQGQITTVVEDPFLLQQ